MFDIGIELDVVEPARLQLAAARAGEDHRQVRVRMGVAVGIAAGVHDHRIVQDRSCRRRPSIAASLSRNLPKYVHVELVDLGDHIQVLRLPW